ncbi:MAG: hypothetical protein ACXVB1_15010 [Pseudobdellovibrionaceae bacterium]
MKKTGVFFFFLLSAFTSLSLAATLYVRPGASGNNSGSDWSNAYNGLPSSLTRGNTYYLATGNYGDHTFNDANSGTSLITLKKATAADHGTESGWSSTYGTGQAIFTGWDIYTDYYVFDGQGRNSNWRSGGLDQYGISTGNTRIDNGMGVGGDNLTFRYIDIHGGGRDTGAGDDVIYGLTGNSNITFQYCALHDSDRTIFTMRGNWQNLVVDSSYMARNTSTPTSHGELLSTTDSTNVTFSNNAIEDIEGTAVWAFLNDGLASGWKIFGNTVYYTPAYIAETGRNPDHNYGIAGVIFCANDSSQNNTCNNFQFYNNTMVNIQGLWSGLVIQQGTGNIVENNIWYDSVRTANSGVSTGWNWYYNTVQDNDTSATKQICSSNCNIFVDILNRDFRLTTATSSGTTLSAPFNVDPNGISRGSDGVWDRGAFEFGSTSQPPASTTLKAPTNLRIL